MAKLSTLVGGPVRASVIGVRAPALDPHAALAELRLAGASDRARGAVAHRSAALAQRLLGGPSELDAPRPLTQVEQSLWALVVATAVEDTGVAGEVWPGSRRAAPPSSSPLAFDVVSRDLGEVPMTVTALCPPGLRSAAAARAAVAGRGPSTVPVVRRPVRAARGGCRPARGPRRHHARARAAELVIFAGAVGLRRLPSAVDAAVSTGYVGRDMTLPDDAHVELTVALGTTQLSLRQLAELVPGADRPARPSARGTVRVRARPVGSSGGASWWMLTASSACAS